MIITLLKNTHNQNHQELPSAEITLIETQTQEELVLEVVDLGEIEERTDNLIITKK